MAEQKNPVDDELDTSKIGAFEADRIDNVEKQKIVKMVSFANLRRDYYTVPEQGSWHLERKRAVIRDHPNVKELYGNNPWTALILACVLPLHIYLSVFFSQFHWSIWLLGCYIIGSWGAFVLQVIGHEGTHRLVFKNGSLNRLVAIFAFLPVFWGPFGTFWMFEHMWHHNIVIDKAFRYGPQSSGPVKKALLTAFFIVIVNVFFGLSAIKLGILILKNLPSKLQGKTDNWVPKDCKVPPYDRFPQALNGWTAFNILCCFLYNLFIISYFGVFPFLYQFLASSFMNGLHPLGMRQVQEHYYLVKGQPTNSVYTSWHTIFLNIGHHNEHHDFPNIPWNRLPQLTELAPEYYKNLKHYTSYIQIMVEFFTNPGIPLDELFDETITTPWGEIPPKGKKAQ